MRLDEFAARVDVSWHRAGLKRHERTVTGPQRLHTTIGNRPARLASSSNYLGLSHHPAVIAAAQEACARWGAGSGGSRLTTGTTGAHVAAEAALSEFFAPSRRGPGRFGTGRSAVLFPSGYHANVGVFSALATATRRMGTALVVLSDAANHASIIDGIRLARMINPQVHLDVYGRRDTSDLAKCLARHEGLKLVVTDGVFSMSGQLAEVDKISALCREAVAWLMVDDAHGTGTVGLSGRGCPEHFGVDYPEFYVGTASKALGAEGGFVVCSDAVATMLRNHARTYIFSTSLAPASCAALTAALALVPTVVPTLHNRVAYTRRRLRELGFDSAGGNSVAGDAAASDSAAGDSPAPIVAIPIGDEARALAAAQRLEESGIFINAIRYPTVPAGAALLRLTVTAEYTEEDIDDLALSIARAVE